MSKIKDNPLVSVLIPTYNSEEYLEKCLKSIKNQTYHNIEIIVVDNYSKDKTVEIARRYTKKVYFRGQERSAQMNYGIKKAKGKYAYRVDSDFVVGVDVIEEAVSKCEKEGFDAVCVPNISDPSVSFWSKVRKFERSFYRGRLNNTSARFFDKNTISKLGGFDENLVACEDYDLQNKMLANGLKIGFIDSGEIHLGEPKTILDVIKGHFYYGATLKFFYKKNPNRARKQLNFIRPGYLNNLSKFIKNPILTLGFLFYQSVRYASAGVGHIFYSFKGDIV